MLNSRLGKKKSTSKFYVYSIFVLELLIRILHKKNYATFFKRFQSNFDEGWEEVGVFFKPGGKNEQV